MTHAIAEIIDEDVRRAVARCVAENAILRVGPVATRIATAHMTKGVSVQAIAAMLLKAGISAAVAMEIQMPDSDAAPLPVLG